MKFYEFNEDEKRIDIFNERFYPRKLEGGIKWYRNVTTQLGIVDKGYYYHQFLKSNGFNADVITARAGDFGSLTHGLIERFLLKEKVSYYDLSFNQELATFVWERFNVWLGWFKEFSKEHKIEYKPEAVELITYSDTYESAGTCDWFPKIDNVPCLFDWKTGKNVYDEHIVQLVTYMRILEEEYKITIPKGYIGWFPEKKITIDEDGKKKYSPNKKSYRIIEVVNSPEAFDLYLSARKWFNKKNTDQPKILTLPLEVNLESLTKE